MAVVFALLLLLLSSLVSIAQNGVQNGGELRFSLRTEPKTFDPMLVSDESSEAIRYLTGGVLVRLNRQSRTLEPGLALRWKISENGRRIDFTLRPGVSFSDGTPFKCEDVVYTIRELMNPATHSPTADSFRAVPGSVESVCTGPDAVMVRFPGPVAGLEGLFDQVAIVSSRSGRKDSPVLGPFVVAEYKPGAHVLLRRNAHYWKRDPQGHPLPRLDTIHLSIQQNREAEMIRFERGQVDLIDKLNADVYDVLKREKPATAVDAGPTLDWEVVFFNQSPAAPIPGFKKAWFASGAFRRAISEAINRDDVCRIVFRGRAVPAAGPVSPTNSFWLNSSLKPHPYNPQRAIGRLAQEGFRRQGEALVDKSGNRVEFSMITNAGNKAHERMLAMIQQDLAKIGIRLNVAALDFASLVERISKTFDYETCLMAWVNIGLDPNEQMNVWLSSGENHQWNPRQKSPASAWEAEIDQHMRIQASAADPKKRKAAFDHVQQVIWEQAPMLFLVFPNALSAVAADLRSVAPAPLHPRTYWNIEYLKKAESRD